MTKEIFQGIFGGLLAVIICVGVGSLIASAMPHSDHSGDAHGDETHTEGSAHTNGAVSYTHLTLPTTPYV